MKARDILASRLMGRVIPKLVGLFNGFDNKYIKILVYHDIKEKDHNRFKTHINYIDKYYGFIEPKELQDIIKRNTVLKRIKVLLTFDDGFKSNAVVAKKFLNPLGIKALFFVPLGIMETLDHYEQRVFIAEKMFNRRFKTQDITEDTVPMTWTDLEYLLEKGHTIGAHTINHRRLTEIENESELRREIIESGDILEERLGIKINHFAYPFGDFNSINSEAIDIIKERYAFCYSAVRGRNYAGNNAYALLREAISTDDSPEYLRFLIEDGLGILYKRRALQLNKITND
jgi:peptidoglycan/xylan/chitin deacetylase (PgdA/CDA1 family)